MAKFPEEYSGQVAAESLRESDLRYDIDRLSSQIDRAHDTLSQIGASKLSDDNKRAALTQQSGIIEGLELAKIQLEEKLEKLLTFHAVSPNLFSDIEALHTAIKTGAAQIENSWDAGQGKFKLLENTQWQENIDDDNFAQAYHVQRPEGMSNSDWRTYKHTIRTQAEALKKDGWTEDAITDGYVQYLNDNYSISNGSVKEQLKTYFETAHTFGSDIFITMWNIDTAKLDGYEVKERPKKAQTLLNIAMKYTGMPEELTGTQAEAQELVGRMSKTLAPHDKFWDTFALTVQKAYPDDKGANSLGDKGGNEALKRQVHQFRYVISAQQAQWVRDNYKKEGMTDEDALVAYFKDGYKSEYKLDHSARLHNKVALDSAGNPMYPGGKHQANFKILSGDFHTEFIVSEDGSFVNEVDPDKPDGQNQNGIVNGASFNYASGDSDHNRLDVKTPGVYDPQYRRDVTNTDNPDNRFRSPDWDTEYQDKNDDRYNFTLEDGSKESTKAHEDRVRERFKKRVEEKS